MNTLEVKRDFLKCQSSHYSVTIIAITLKICHDIEHQKVDEQRI